MCFNVACSAGAKVVVEGEALSLSGLHRVLDLCHEYSRFIPVTIAVHSSNSDPRNVIRYLPVEDFRYAEDVKHAALIDLDLDEDEDDDVDDEEDEDEDEEQIDFSTPQKRPKKFTISVNFDT